VPPSQQESERNRCCRVRGSAVVAGARSALGVGFVEFIAFVLLGGLGFVEIFQLANVTVDVGPKHYTCCWGPFVPVRWIYGHLGDVAGLEIVGGGVMTRGVVRGSTPSANRRAHPDRCPQDCRRRPVSPLMRSISSSRWGMSGLWPGRSCFLPNQRFSYRSDGVRLEVCRPPVSMVCCLPRGSMRYRRAISR